MLRSFRSRGRLLWAIMAAVIVLQLVQNAHPSWAWLGLANNAIAILILTAAVASLVWLIIRGRRAYRLLMGADTTARERFAQQERAKHVSGTIIEGEVVNDKKVQSK